MKFKTKEDIEAPLAFVYSALSDFEYWERAAMRRGADVNRTDKMRVPAAGMGWKIDFQYGGKARSLDVKLLTLETDQQMSFDTDGTPARGNVTIEMVEMGPKRTRVAVEVDIKPKTLTARMFIQSLRLARTKVNRKYELRVAQVAADIEDRYRAQVKA
jgi:carbon monoxide dehydrogenase subunit G